LEAFAGFEVGFEVKQTVSLRRVRWLSKLNANGSPQTNSLLLPVFHGWAHDSAMQFAI
jgi:hypothetical protein